MIRAQGPKVFRALEQVIVYIYIYLGPKGAPT